MLFLGNKSGQQDIEVKGKYSGDSSVSLFTKPNTLDSVVRSKNQIKQELVINYNSIPY